MFRFPAITARPIEGSVSLAVRFFSWVVPKSERRWIIVVETVRHCPPSYRCEVEGQDIVAQHREGERPADKAEELRWINDNLGFSRMSPF